MAQSGLLARKKPALGARDRHFIRRFSAGYTPALAKQVRKAGGGRAWFDDQLRMKGKDKGGKKVDAYFPSLKLSPSRIKWRNDRDIEGPWQVMAQLSSWTMLRRIYGRHQLHEQMVEFWSNLLHVPLTNDKAWYHRVSFDRMIRKHALGRFDKMLVAATLHPAQGLHLDNVSSSKDDPNENLGRELLELHSVGIGAYTEKDVKHSSRLLTGFRVDYSNQRSYYDPDEHYVGRIKVMGFKTANKSRDGRKATKAYLKYLARHPRTARRIAHRLCVRFVSDDPPKALVKAVAKAYLRNKTAIAPTLRAMVDHPAFAKSAGKKVRTPLDDYVATIRALGIKIYKPQSDQAFARAMHWQISGLGQAPYDWPAPDGYPMENAAWATSGRVLTSFSMHRSLAGGWYPKHNARYRKLGAWVPKTPVSLGKMVDKVGERLLGERPSRAEKEAVAKVIGKSLSYQLTDDNTGDWMVASVLATLLDSPTHMKR